MTATDYANDLKAAARRLAERDRLIMEQFTAALTGNLAELNRELQKDKDNDQNSISRRTQAPWTDIGKPKNG